MTDSNNKSELPKGWVSAKLGELIKLEYGEALKKDQRDSEGAIPVYGSNGIVGYHSISLTNRPCLIVGRKGAAGAVRYSKVPCWPIDTTYFVYPPNGINIIYLHYLLTTLNLSSLDKSTAIPGLNRDDAYTLLCPLPPLPEQHRIVNKIEELFTRLDAGVETLKKIQLQLKRYRQSVLKAAFEGKLTADWRETHKSELEPASVLLERIKVERKNKLGNKYKNLPPVDISELSGLPEGWAWTTPSRIADIRLGKMLDRQKNKGNLLPYLRNLNVRWNEFDFSDLQNMRFEPHEVERFQVKSGDALVCEGGEPGRAAVWQVEDGTIQYQKALHRVRPFAGIQASWIVYSLWKDSLSESLGRYFTGSTIKHFTGESFNRYVLPIAPSVEQSKITAEVDLQMSTVEKTEHVIDHELKRAERLRQSILKKAFEGKLVPQDPTDEPAEKLLERIKKTKTELERSPVRRKI